MKKLIYGLIAFLFIAGTYFVFKPQSPVHIAYMIDSKYLPYMMVSLNSAIKNGWIKDYTWFEDGVKIRAEKKRKWNRETCFNEAKKYASRGEFAKGNNSACAVARKNGI